MHRTLLTKPYEVIDRQGKTTYAGTQPFSRPSSSSSPLSLPLSPLLILFSCVPVGCPGEGCDTNTRFANYVCAGCKGKDFSWYHIVMTDKEGAYLLKAWQGRGLGFSANSKLSHRYCFPPLLRALFERWSAAHSFVTFSITICNLCLCAGFPGAASKLCESKQGKLISPVTGAPMDVARWKDSHAHLKGTQHPPHACIPYSPRA